MGYNRKANKFGISETEVKILVKNLAAYFYKTQIFSNSFINLAIKTKNIWNCCSNLNLN